jgi:hypothetical protein
VTSPALASFQVQKVHRLAPLAAPPVAVLVVIHSIERKEIPKILLILSDIIYDNKGY